jgi:soluble lytic murein transglycosylase-like protein
MGDGERWHIAETIQREGQRYGYDPLFVLAMIQVESSCSSTARGPTGSVGLIQLQPSVARELARRVGIPWSGTGMLTHPGVNVKLGLHYLTELEERFQDPWIAVAAYNLGPGRIARMPRPLARRTRYVRRILSRYEKLLAEAAGAVQTPG